MMGEFGGLAMSMPRYATIYAIMLMASVGLPLTIGFVGEFLSLVGFFRISPIMTAIAGITIILGAVYMLTLYKRSFFGPITNEENRNLPDLTKQELSALVPLVLLVVALGIYPKPLLDPIDNSVKSMLKNMQEKSQTEDAKDLLAKATRIGEAK